MYHNYKSYTSQLIHIPPQAFKSQQTPASEEETRMRPEEAEEEARTRPEEDSRLLSKCHHSPLKDQCNKNNTRQTPVNM